MKKNIYQGILGVFLIAATVILYQIYKKDNLVYVINNESNVVNITDMKPNYQYVASKDLLAKQQGKNNFEKVKLNISLSELHASTQKSLEMINDYNLKNPNNKITSNFVLKLLEDSTSNFDDIQAQPSYEYIQKQVEVTNKKFELANSKELVSYQSSINSIAKVIEQINENIN